MISAYVRRQLAVFLALTLTATLVILFSYAHITTLLGFGRIPVTAVFSDGAGIYTNANVTARGVGIGKVTGVSYTPDGVAVAMSIDTDTKVSADATAAIHSVSAVGEQYVDLISPRDGGPYLGAGAVIPMSRTSVPEQIAPVLDKAKTLLASIPADGLRTFVDQGYRAFNGMGPDLRTLLDSSRNLITVANNSYARTAQLIQTVGPLLDTQNQAASSVLSYFADLANFTGALRDDDRYLRHGLPEARRATVRISDFFDDNANGTTILAENTRTLGRLLGVYRPGIEQVLVQYPVVVAWEQMFGTGTEQGQPRRGPHIGLQVDEVPEGCSQGYGSALTRNPQDLSDAEPVPYAHCNVPHDDPRMVRDARNVPCLEGHVGMRAATVQECFGQPAPGGGGPVSSAGPNIVPANPFGGVTTAPRGPFTPPDQRDPNPDDLGSGDGSDDPLTMLGGMGSPDRGADQTWQSLLTAPLHR